MTAENLKLEIEIRKLKEANKQLMNTNTLLNRQNKNLSEHFDKKVNEEVNKKIKLIEKNQEKLQNNNLNNGEKLQKKYSCTKGLYQDYEQVLKANEKLQQENKRLALATSIAEDEQRRLAKIVAKKDNKIYNLNIEVSSLKKELIELNRTLGRLEVLQNNDGTTSGIPTSQTPTGKKKIIPNSRKNTGDKIGRKEGHQKDKLYPVSEDKIKEHIKHELKECPHCKKNHLEETGKVIKKQVKDYKIIVYNTSHDFIEYKCCDCGKLVHELIPNHLKEECQYGSTVKSLALSLTNIGNVAFNKTRRILKGLSIEEIEPCEGYLAKLQKQASKKLEPFINELHQAIVNSLLIHWDDTVIMINKKQACMRYYGNDDICLFKAHERKNKEGLDKDRILNLLGSNVVVVHDHNKVNYNPIYGFINAECCQHLIRDLRKVEINIPNRTWCKEAIKLFQEFDHKRNELIKEGIDTFSSEEINDFILRLDDLLLKGLKEYEEDNKPHYASKEITLIWRIMEYRDNYIYWILDFDIPFTNNLSERNLRGVKSKMKVSGQFQNINSAEDYANIRSYIETCRLYGKNEYDCLSKLVEGNPYTFAELIAEKN